jgi:type IV fimbrial biogenesis protein FimT
MDWRSSSSGIERGFSLIEQIMVVAIMATLLAVAIPAMSHLLTRSYLQTAQTDLIAAIQHARATAATTGKVTLLCPSQDQRHCRGDNHWESGWLLAYDLDRDSQPDDDKVLYSGTSYNGKLTILGNAGRKFVRFQPDGSAGGSNITLILCPREATDKALSVIVSNSGRVRGGTASTEQSNGCGGAH